MKLSKQEIEVLRSIPFPQIFDAFDFRWKFDNEFKPTKANPKTKRLVIDTDEGFQFELLVTPPKWYDTRAKKGGGGAIDLVMHLRECSFTKACEELQKICTGA